MQRRIEKSSELVLLCFEVTRGRRSVVPSLPSGEQEEGQVTFAPRQLHTRQ